MADTTRPFVISPGLAKLTGAYPSAQDVLEAASKGQREKAILARLWISEGIPFAFRNCPGIYEEFRASLADRLDIDAKHISVAGSGRLGYSLAPKKWGQAYQSLTSDLDWFAVSEGLFERLCRDFERWHAEYGHGEVTPETETERYYWDKNREETPNQIQKGFIDSYRVPNFRRYAVFSATNRRLENLRVKLEEAEEAPNPPPRLSLRCYRDWPAYEAQMAISLQAVINRRARSAAVNRNDA